MTDSRLAAATQWAPSQRGICVAPRASLDRMNPFLEHHRIKPVIDKV